MSVMLLRQSTAVVVPIFMTDSTDHVSGVDAVEGSMVITASKAGAAFGAVTPSSLTDLGDGWYAVGLSTTHTNTLGALVLHITADDSDPTDVVFQVIAANLEDAVRLGLTALPNAAAEAAGGLYTRGTGAGQINQPANGRVDTNVVAIATAAVTADATPTDAIGAAELAAAAVSEVVAAMPTTAAIRDAMLDYAYRTGRTWRGLMRRLGAALEKATGLKGSTVTYFQPDGSTTEFSVPQDTAAGTRAAATVTNSEVP